MGCVGGFVIVVGSLIFISAAPPLSKIYGGQELEGRMALSSANRPACLFSQGLFNVGAAVTAIGFVVLSPSLRTSGRPAWLPALASGWILLGTAAWLYFAHQRTANPEAHFEDQFGVP